MTSSNSATAAVAEQNAWVIVADGAEPQKCIVAHTRRQGGMTVTIASDNVMIRLSVANEQTPENAIVALSARYDELGFSGTPSVQPCISDCGAYLYASIGSGAHIQIKLEADGLVFDAIDTSEDCVDTAAIYYSDLESLDFTE